MTVASHAITFQPESIAEFWDEALALAAANHAETGFLDGARFAPDYDQYRALDEIKRLRLFTMREDGKLAGYAVHLVTQQHLHYPGTAMAMQDVLYVAPWARGLNAVAFLEWMDETLKAQGVEFVIRQVTTKVDYHRTLERMGYKPVSTTFLKEL